MTQPTPNLAELHRENVADVNARLAAAGRCVLHNPEDNRPATVIIGLPNGNEIPLCAECWEWWQGTIRDANADPNVVPDWVHCLSAAS
jgi:hypothetical protein